MVGAALGFGEDVGIMVGEVGGDLFLDFAWFASLVGKGGEVRLWERWLVVSAGWETVEGCRKKTAGNG